MSASVVMVREQTTDPAEVVPSPASREALAHPRAAVDHLVPIGPGLGGAAGE